MMTIEQAVESLRGELVESVQRLVRLKSVKGEPKPGMPFGEDVDRCYRGFLQLAESLGFVTKDFDGYAGHAEIGQGDKVLGILGHVDTVPLGDGWDLDPCSGALVDGKIYGRGVMDDKGPTIACLYAVKALQLAGVPLTKKIRVIFGLDEESDWECMAHYLPLAGEPDCSFTPDGSFPVIYGEKGMCNYNFVGSFSGKNPAGVSVLSITGGNRPNMVPDRCTARLTGAMDLEKAAAQWAAAAGEQVSVSRDGEEYVVEITGISAHGSTPEKGKNAATLMMQFLSTLPLSEAMGGAARFYLDHIVGHYGEHLGCAMTEEICGPLTVNIGVIHYDGEKLCLTANTRYPIGHQVEEVYGPIRQTLAGSGYQLEPLNNKAPLYVDPKSPLVEKLMAAYIEATGDHDHPPITISGGTYARAVKNAVAFGPIFPGHPEVGHQKNEWAAVEDLMLCAKVYAKAIAALMSED